ncbi:hypothetical protein LCGC14_1131550 [marine sediment metagenome]|uniref:Uncharacterized protein n=1 Tax=marine sediment metagenome TaxID=412755 RepID=A0A0F9Q6Q9_9ZZZZ
MSAWSIRVWISAVAFCLSGLTFLWLLYKRRMAIRAATAAEALRAIDAERKQRYRKLAEADAAEPITCPVCTKSVMRGQMQKASVKQPTEPGKSLHVKQLVCDDCIGSGERLVTGARARRSFD